MPSSGRFYSPLVGRPNLWHPLCAGLRALVFFDSVKAVNQTELGFDGSPTGGSLSFSHRFGPGLALTRASSQFVRLGTVGHLGFTGSCTMMVKFRTNSSPGAGNNAVVLGCDDGGTDRGCLLEVNAYAGSVGAGIDGPTFWAQASTTEARAASQNVSFPANTDILLCGVYNSPADTATLYRDGLQVAQNTHLFGAAGTPYNVSAATTVYVGRRDFGTSDDFFDGTVFWVAIFNRALTAAEVRVWSQETWDFLDNTEAVLVPEAVAAETPPAPRTALAQSLGVADPFFFVFRREHVGVVGPEAVAPAAEPFEVAFPPVPGAPWNLFRGRPVPIGGATGDTVPPTVPPVPPVPSETVNRPLVPRVPRMDPSDPRFARFTEIVSQIFNDLYFTGQLTKNPTTGRWEITP